MSVANISCAQTTLDRCVNCTIVVAACSTSIFARKCTGCTFAFGAKQLRFREAHNCTVLAACHSRPVIEASTGLRFGCWRLWYQGLQAHLTAAKIDVWANKWNHVYDFDTAQGAGGTVNWSSLDSPQEISAAKSIVQAAPAALAASVQLRVVVDWISWFAPAIPEKGSMAAQVANGAADSNAPQHHGKPAQATPASESEVQRGLAQNGLDASSPPASHESAGAPEPAAATPPTIPNTAHNVTTNTQDAPSDERWEPCVPLTAPLGAPTAAFLLLLPGSNWKQSGMAALAAVSSDSAGEAGAMAVSRCRAFAPSAEQAAALVSQVNTAGASAGPCLGVQLQWCDAADEGTDAGTLVTSRLSKLGLGGQNVCVLGREQASAAVQRWFVDWEYEFNK